MGSPRSNPVGSGAKPRLSKVRGEAPSSVDQARDNARPGVAEWGDGVPA